MTVDRVRKWPTAVFQLSSIFNRMCASKCLAFDLRAEAGDLEAGDLQFRMDAVQVLCFMHCQSARSPAGRIP